MRLPERRYGVAGAGRWNRTGHGSPDGETRARWLDAGNADKPDGVEISH